MTKNNQSSSARYLLVLTIGIVLCLVFFIHDIASGKPLEGTVQENKYQVPSHSVVIIDENEITGTQSITEDKTIGPPIEPIIQVSIAVSTTNYYLPFASNSIYVPPPMPPHFELYCSNPDKSIPDNSPGGIQDTITISTTDPVLDMDVRLDVRHPFIGDLFVTLTHIESGKSVTLTDRPGYPNTAQGCGADDIKGIFSDDISLPAENQCSSSPSGIAGIFKPTEPLNLFDLDTLQGTWSLSVSDLAESDQGSLKSWCVGVTAGDPSLWPPEPPKPTVPNHAKVTGVTGKNQALPLDCESRVAVDYANFFGVKIGELEFFNHLPVSDNPDLGFVGSVYGTWGQIPPKPYGIHAEPVAELLRSYGVEAYAHRPLRWEDVQAEIAAGKPVYVWVIGSASFNEVPIYFQSTDGHISIVAHYEHTVMVIGYTDTTVTILDGGVSYVRDKKVFLSSWSALNNMAITSTP